jgi:hypothetical protein
LKPEIGRPVWTAAELGLVQTLGEKFDVDPVRAVCDGGAQFPVKNLTADEF